LDYVEKDQENVRLGDVSIDNENGNIAKSSILALGRCLRTILLADTVGERFKLYILEIVLEFYCDLRGKHPDYARVLLLVLRPESSYETRASGIYADLIRRGIGDLDSFKYFECKKALERELR
jgi:hypothetical protein